MKNGRTAVKQLYERQLGASTAKSIAILAAIGLMLIFIVFVATSPPKENTGNQANDQATENQTTTSGELPDGFKRFSSRQYNFSVAFPESWGSLLTQDPMEGSILRATTKDVTHTIGNSKINGSLNISTYRINDFRVATRLGGQILAASKSGDTVTWKVATAIPEEPQYAIGSTFPVKNSTNPAGIVIHDFSRVLDGRRQSAWAFEAKDTIIFMTLPLVGLPETTPTSADLKEYADFTKSVTDSLKIPE